MAHALLGGGGGAALMQHMGLAAIDAPRAPLADDAELAEFYCDDGGGYERHNHHHRGGAGNRR